MPHDRSYSYTCRKDVWTKARGAIAFEMNDVPLKKRRVTVKIVLKWVADSDREMDTSVWLRYDKVDHEFVAMLK